MKIKFIISMLLIILFCSKSSAITVGLLSDVNKSYIATSDQGAVIDGHSGCVLLPIKKMCRYNVKNTRRNIAIQLDDGHYYNTGTDHLIIACSNGFVSTKEKWYRGCLIIKKIDNGLTFINDVGLEDYLLGVVPSEMPTSWNLEALKAQAIAARSFAISNLGKRSSMGFDLKDTPEDQAYGGASCENERSSKAVIETKGHVLVYQGNIINAYYCSSAGGRTKLASEAWYKDLPYIRSVYSYDDNIPQKGHGVGMSQYGANYLANNDYNAYQILNYFYNNVSLGKIKGN
jgi:stage II sporulation protein D